MKQVHLFTRLCIQHCRSTMSRILLSVGKKMVKSEGPCSQRPYNLSLSHPTSPLPLSRPQHSCSAQLSLAPGDSDQGNALLTQIYTTECAIYTESTGFSRENLGNEEVGNT